MSDVVSFTEAELLASLTSVRRYARKLTGNAAEADDLVQSVVERALHKRARFQHGTNLTSWLMALAHNAHVNEIRRRARAPLSAMDETVVERTAAPRCDPISVIEVKEMRSLLDRLPRQQQRLLVLAAVSGDNYEQMARYEATPIGTVRSRLSRGRALLRLLSRGTELSSKEREALDAAAD